MGTNYYAHYQVCKECHEPKKVVHIGKSSFGWVFLFYSPGASLYSASAWKRELLQDNLEIKNEYGDRIEHNKFWELVETSKKNNLNHYRCITGQPGNKHEEEYLNEHARLNIPLPTDAKNEWIDKTGFPFTSSKFS